MTYPIIDAFAEDISLETINHAAKTPYFSGQMVKHTDILLVEQFIPAPGTWYLIPGTRDKSLCG